MNQDETGDAAKVRACDAIAARLSGTEWDAETMGDVAEILLGAGYVIDGPDDEDANGHLAACDGFCGVPGGCGGEQ